MGTVRIGTRGSELALWQAHHIADRLRAAHAGLEVELVVIRTTGDRIVDRPLAEVGGKGLFVKEIEEALLDGRVDLAVHSLKDVPGELPDGLVLSTYAGRANPFDALCARAPLRSVDDLPQGARVGTGSSRRGLQLKRLRPDIELVAIRGNVPTRLARRGADGDLDAVVLAAAGLRRLGLWSDDFIELAPPDVVPAASQGTLALEIRAADDATAALVAPLDDAAARLEATTERACLDALGGDCHTPFAAFARLDGGQMTLHGRVFNEAGAHFDERAVVAAPTPDACAAAGRAVGAALRSWIERA